MSHFALFTDVSLNPRLKIGLGAYLLIPSAFLEKKTENIEYAEIAKIIKFKEFENTSSTKLEVETVLWSLDNFLNEFRDTDLPKLCLYTDSQCVTGLLSRREGLEAHHYQNKSNNHIHQHTYLYKSFFELHDKLNFEVIKVVGHSPSYSHDTVQRIFSIIDREVRGNFKHRISKF
jgi:ribonuclease HI